MNLEEEFSDEALKRSLAIVPQEEVAAFAWTAVLAYRRERHCNRLLFFNLVVWILLAFSLAFDLIFLKRGSC